MGKKMINDELIILLTLLRDKMKEPKDAEIINNALIDLIELAIPEFLEKYPLFLGDIKDK